MFERGGVCYAQTVAIAHTGRASVHIMFVYDVVQCLGSLFMGDRLTAGQTSFDFIWMNILEMALFACTLGDCRCLSFLPSYSERSGPFCQYVLEYGPRATRDERDSTDAIYVLVMLRKSALDAWPRSIDPKRVGIGILPCIQLRASHIPCTYMHWCYQAQEHMTGV